MFGSIENDFQADICLMQVTCKTLHFFELSFILCSSTQIPSSFNVCWRVARICLSFSLFNHKAHPHLVSPEPWLKAPSPHWQPVTPALHQHTSHSSQASDLVSAKWTPEAISYIFPLLTFLLTYLLCPLQHCVLRSPVSSFSSDLLSVHPSLILRCVFPSVSTSSCQDIYPLVIYSSSIDPLLWVSDLPSSHLHYSAVKINPLHLN